MSSSAVSFKIVLIGEGSVGKTAIRQQYLGEGFGGKYQMTIGADFAVKRVDVDGTLYVIQIWDLAGQSGFLNTRKLYYGGAMAALLVFDITRPPTFQKCDNWIREIQDNRGELIPIILIGNKSDLRDEVDNVVSIANAKAYAKQLRSRLGFPVTYIETSAKEGKNIEYAFKSIIAHIQKSMAGEEWDLQEEEEEDEYQDQQEETTLEDPSHEDVTEADVSEQETITQVTEQEANSKRKAPIPQITDSVDEEELSEVTDDINEISEETKKVIPDNGKSELEIHQSLINRMYKKKSEKFKNRRKQKRMNRRFRGRSFRK